MLISVQNNVIVHYLYVTYQGPELTGRGDRTDRVCADTLLVLNVFHLLQPNVI